MAENPACPARPVESEGHSSGVAPADGTGVNPARPVKFEDHLTGVKKEKSLAEKTVEDVLKHFGKTIKKARRRYRQFVKKGIDQGKRPDLQGGGLVRSAGGDKRGLLGRKKEEREKGDARILGSGDFVANVMKDANEVLDQTAKFDISLDELISRVCAKFEIKVTELVSKSRKRYLSQARGVSDCRERGKKILDKPEITGEYLA